MPASGWLTRYHAIGRLLETARPDLDDRVSAGVSSRGELLDLASGRLGKATGKAGEVLRIINELRLDAEADFETIDTLIKSSCSRVDVVKTTLAPGALFVRKTVDKAFAMRMRGVRLLSSQV